MSCILQTRCNLLLPNFVGQTIQKRFNKREAIHRYYEPNKFKKHMLAYTEPYYKRDYRRLDEKCNGNRPKPIELLPISKIYVEELLEDVNKSEFVLFIQHNYTPFLYERPYKNTITKSGGTFVSHKNVVYKEVFCSRLGQMDKLAACVTVLRKMPQFLLLAGLIDKEIITYGQLQSIAAYKNIDQSRANLLSTLETPAIDLSYYLEQHSQNSNNGDGGGGGEDDNKQNE